MVLPNHTTGPQKKLTCEVPQMPTEQTNEQEYLNRRQFVAGAATATALAGLAGGSAIAATFEGDELAYMPGSLQLQLFRTGALSPVDVLEAQIERIERFNGDVNCITYKHYEAARQAAKDSEVRWRSGKGAAAGGHHGRRQGRARPGRLDDHRRLGSVEGQQACNRPIRSPSGCRRLARSCISRRPCLSSTCTFAPGQNCGVSHATRGI